MKRIIRFIFSVAVIFAFAVQASAMSFEDARHLLNRTGFGATPQQIDEFAKMDWEPAIDKILAGTETKTKTPLPFWADQPVGGLFTLRLLALKGLKGEDVRLERESIRRKQEAQERQRGNEIRAWWWNEMIQTDSPLNERMVLFWHNHFTSEIDTVRSPELMLQQNQMFRKHATGNFAELLLAATTDPAMIIYLDNNSNVKGNPNENFAREVMELFTLGEGHIYTEEDIKEAARAFTGWRVDNIKKEFVFNKNLHDFGEKKVLGKTGKFNGDDIIKILLEEKRTANFITEKMWKYMISDDPDADEVERIAYKFRESKYEIKVLLKEILMSEHFRSPGNRGNLIKSPADLVVGTCRLFGAHPAQSYQISEFAKLLGQDLFQPPDVAGWRGGANWIDANTLIIRHQLSRLVLQKPDANFIKNFERRQRQQKIARLEAEKEKREIAMLMKSSKSMLDNIMDGDDDLMSVGGNDDVAMMNLKVSDALNNKMSIKDQVASEYKSMEAVDLQTWLKKQGLDKEQDRLFKILLPIQPIHEVPQMMAAGEAINSLLLDPAFQLK